MTLTDEYVEMKADEGVYGYDDLFAQMNIIKKFMEDNEFAMTSTGGQCEAWTCFIDPCKYRGLIKVTDASGIGAPFYDHDEVLVGLYDADDFMLDCQRMTLTQLLREW